MKSVRWYSLLLVLIACVHAGCMRLPKSDFDPYPPSKSQMENPEFQTFDETYETLPENLLKPSAEPYRLGPGDILDIEIAEVPDTLARTFIMPDGMIYYNLAGGVPAEDLTVAELSDRLEAALSTDYTSPVVNVTLIEVRSRRYWLLGRVYNPGIYPLRQPTTLIEAISMAGGLFSARFSGSTEELADLGSSIVIRDGEILPVDFARLIREGDMSHNIYLRHNDYIYLPSAQSNSVLLLGNINQPKAVSFKDSLSIVECIAYGLGPSAFADLSNVVIVRGSLRDPQLAVVDFKAIATGKKADVALKPGDIVWIPKDPWKTVQQYAKEVARSAAQAIAINEGTRATSDEEPDTTITVPVGVSP